MSENPESARLGEARTAKTPWRKWGPYLSEPQWGTVREDYSEDGNACSTERSLAEVRSWTPAPRTLSTSKRLTAQTQSPRRLAHLSQTV